MSDTRPLTPLDAGEITAERVALFAGVALDDNALHLDAQVARAAGFPAQIVHGVFLANLFEVFLRENGLISIRRLESNFLKPVTVGEGISISGRELGIEGQWRHVRLIATDRGGKICAVGEALASETARVSVSKT